jgi:hypothetical protein
MGALATAYLASYNSLQALGWGAVLALTLLPVLRGATVQEAFLSGSVPASECRLNLSMLPSVQRWLSVSQHAPHRMS